MKKLMVLSFCFIIVSLLFSQVEEENYFLENIDSIFIGYYVSVDFINALKETKNYPYAWALGWDNTYNAHIIVSENGIIYYPFYSDCYFEVSTQEFINYNFEYNNIDEIIIIDPNGNRYKKMTDNYDYENYNRVMNNFIGNIVLADLINNGNIIIDNEFIFIPSLDNKELKITSWQYYSGGDNNLLLTDYDINNDWRVLLNINNNELTIFYDPPIWRRGERVHIILKIII